MKNSIINQLIKFFAIVFIAGLMASCASIADSGVSENQIEKTTFNSDKSDSVSVDPVITGDDEMDPIITPPPTTSGR